MQGHVKTALNEALKKRGVRTKQIIVESDCSRAHFYKLISGERVASETVKKRLAQALCLSPEALERLFQLDRQESQYNQIGQETATSESSQATDKLTPAVSIAKTKVHVILLILVALVVLATGFYWYHFDQQSEVIPTGTDNIAFIRDVSIPDGSSVVVESEFTKIWRIKNSGHVPWINRYLIRTTPHFKGICRSVERVEIPEIKPGQTIDIAVKFTSPKLPGSCRTDWKMADENGNFYFPKLPGLFSIVTVVQKTQ